LYFVFGFEIHSNCIWYSKYFLTNYKIHYTTTVCVSQLHNMAVMCNTLPVIISRKKERKTCIYSFFHSAVGCSNLLFIFVGRTVVDSSYKLICTRLILHLAS